MAHPQEISHQEQKLVVGDLSAFFNAMVQMNLDVAKNPIYGGRVR